MEAHAVLRPRASTRRAPARHSLLSDERLARLVATGDERAFGVLYERYTQPLYRYCRSILRHDADAQDALQSAMTSAYAALRRSQRDAPVRPWLFRIAHNESISVLRRRRPAVELTDDLGGAAASVEEDQERRAQLARLLVDLKDLPERQRSALVMRELSGLSHEDIALALNTSVGGAKQAIFEARRALSEFVEGRAMNCEEVCRLVSDADGRVLRGRRVRAHLRDCASCSAFAAMIPSRSAALRALAPPLPAIAAAGLLTRAIGGSSVGNGSAGVAGGAGIAGALGGKTVTLGLVAKALTTVAIVSGATVGITDAVEHSTAGQHHAVRQHAAPAGHAKAADGSAAAAVARQSGHAKPTSAIRTTPAAVRATGRSTHAVPFHTRGKSAWAPSAAVGRGVVRPRGKSVSSTATHMHGSGVGLTKSQQGQALGSQQSRRSTAPTAHHQNARAVRSSKPTGLQLHLLHLLG